MWSGRAWSLPAFAVWLLAPGELGRPIEPPRSPPPPIPIETILEEIEQAAAELPRLRSLLVSYKGELLFERYYNGGRTDRPSNIKSASKSVISALIGIAIDRGLIQGVDTPIARFFPERLRTAADPDKRVITVGDLLSMRSGLETTSSRNYGAWVHSRSWVTYALTRKLVARPGGRMIYSTGNSHLLSAILTQASGTSTWAFAQEVLAEPLGFSLARWPRDPEGIYFGGNDMEMTPRQMLAFGRLYLNRGRIGEKRILTTSWIEQSFVPRGRSSYSQQLYGYGWWMRDFAGRRVYFAWGYGGQYIFVTPSLELVVVSTASTEPDQSRRAHRAAIFKVLDRRIISPLSKRGSNGLPAYLRAD